MSGSAAGVKLRLWFIRMVAILIFVNIAAVTGAVVTQYTVSKVSKVYQPFAATSRAAERYTILAQRDMYEYLSELSDSPKSTLANIDHMVEALNEAVQYAPTEAQENALKELKTLAGQYRIAVEQLPNALSGSKDWGRVEEIRKTAIGYGGEAAKRAAALSSWAQDEIRDRNRAATTLSTVALIVFVAVMATSAVVLLALRHWWKEFQDMILGI